ncbi:MAG: molybdate ABC transporter permease subunit [Eubacteriales bacterium]
MELDLTPLYISLKTAFIATVITFFLGILLARWMVFCRGKGKVLIDGLIIMPMVLPPTVVGFLLLIILGKNGIIGQLLNKLGTSIVFSWTAAVITATVVALPLMYKTAKGAFEQIDMNIVDAAKTLGVSNWNIFWKVILPLSYPGIYAGIILSFARALGEFGATLMLAGNIPGKTQTIPIAIFFAVESGDMNTAYLWVAIIMFISLSAIISMNYWNQKQSKYKYNSRGI